MTGTEALRQAAAEELARVYRNRSPEFKRTEEVLAEEVRHFAETMGWSVGRVALKLRMSKQDVRRILAA